MSFRLVSDAATDALLTAVNNNYILPPPDYRFADLSSAALNSFIWDENPREARGRKHVYISIINRLARIIQATRSPLA
jgi:hypothetical protein